MIASAEVALMIRHGPDWRRWQLEAGEDFYRETAFVYRRGDEVLRIVLEEHSHDAAGPPYRARVIGARDPMVNAAAGSGNSVEAAVDSLLDQIYPGG
jgi:hypothetical protein